MLTPRKRITKKQLKEDKLVTLYAKSRDWVEANFKLVSGAAAVILLLIVGSFFISNAQQKAEVTASTKLAKAINAFDSSDYTTAINILSDIVENSQRTKSAALARLYLGQALYRTNEYSGAMEHFRVAARRLGRDVHLKTTALAGEAACMEQQGQFAQAAKKYETIVRKYPEAPQASYFLLRSARCYELAQDSEKATELYQKLAEDYPNTREKDDALLLNAMR